MKEGVCDLYVYMRAVPSVIIGVLLQEYSPLVAQMAGKHQSHYQIRHTIPN